MIGRKLARLCFAPYQRPRNFIGVMEPRSRFPCDVQEFRISTALILAGLFQDVQRPKPEQQLVVQIIVQGKDVFSELPTGFDKSLTFQVGCYVDVYPA